LGKFEEWKKYCEEYKTPHVHSSTHRQLYQWYRRQRSGRDRLSLAQVELLEKAGFPWVGTPLVITSRWMSRFEAWKRYFERHKTPHVPKRKASLNAWVYYQRKNRDDLSAWKIELLERAGFQWESVTSEKNTDLSQKKVRRSRRSSRFLANGGKSLDSDGDSDGDNESRHLTKKMGRSRNVISSTLKTGDYDEKIESNNQKLEDHITTEISREWRYRFEEWKQYYDKYNVPYVHSKINPNLFEWVRQQRNQRDKLSAMQIELLDKSQFAWHDQLDDRALAQTPKKWRISFQTWKQYHQKYNCPYGNCATHEGVYRWVQKQWKVRGKLTELQLRLLNEAGFVWEGNSVWTKSFEAWKKHIKEHKTPIVHHSENLSLYRWITRIRRERYKLTEKQIHLLDSTGFVWKQDTENNSNNQSMHHKERRKSPRILATSKEKNDGSDSNVEKEKLGKNENKRFVVNTVKTRRSPRRASSSLTSDGAINDNSVSKVANHKDRERKISTEGGEDQRKSNSLSHVTRHAHSNGMIESDSKNLETVRNQNVKSGCRASSSLTSDGAINDNSESKVANHKDRERKSSTEGGEDQRKSNNLSHVTSHAHGNGKIESDSKNLEIVRNQNVKNGCSAQKREHRCNNDISLLKKIPGKVDNKSECNTKIQTTVKSENLEDVHLLTRREQTKISHNPSLAFENDKENNWKKQKVEKDDNCESSSTEKMVTCSRKRNNSFTSSTNAKMVTCSRKRSNSFISTATGIVDDENENTSKFERVDNDVNRNIMNKNEFTRSIDSFTPTSKEKSERQTEKQLSENDDLTRTGVDSKLSPAQDDTALSKNRNSISSALTKVNAKVDDKSESNARKQTVRMYENIDNMGHLKRGESPRVSHSPILATTTNENCKSNAKKRKSLNFDNGESGLSAKIRRYPRKSNSSKVDMTFDNVTEKNAEKQIVDSNRSRDNAETKIFPIELDNCARVMVKTSINDDRRNTEKLVSEQDNIDKSRRAAKSIIPSRMVRISSPTKCDGAMFDYSECDTDRGWVGWESKRESLHLGDMKIDNHVDSIHLARLVETSKKVSESSSKTFNATKVYCKNNIGKQNTDNDSTKAYVKINDNCESITMEDEVRNRHLAISKKLISKTYGYSQASIGWASNNTCDSSRRSESERWCSREGNVYSSKTSCGLQNKDVSIIFSII